MKFDLSWPWMAQQIEVGRSITSTVDPQDLSTPQFFDCWIYFQQQQQQVIERGFCDGRCRSDELKPCGDRIVCRRTLEVCPRRRLSGLVSFYSGVFDEYSNNTSGGPQIHG